MKNYLTVLLFIVPLFTFAQQIDKIYTVSGTVDQHYNHDGVGINEDEPEAALHINQSDDKGIALQIDIEDALQPEGLTDPEFAIRINTFNYQYPAQITNLFSIDKNGTTRIGYGTTGSEKLMVSNSIGIYKSSSSNMVRLGYDGSQSQPQLVWKTSSSQNFQFKNSTTGAIPISLSPDGKVGINTDDFFGNHNLYVDGSVYIKDDGEEDHSLYIEGSSIAEEMFVKLKGDWPDFVFHPEYTLMPLTDLERFIDENGYLPEMPTAEEVKEEGVKTGDTIRLLTQKVEELTLYLLQQQKEIDALKEKLDK